MDSLREELIEALEDYVESCHRQGIEFDSAEKRRFMRENKHMNLSEEETQFIEQYTD